MYEVNDNGGLACNENECVGCGKDYNETTSIEDWIKCPKMLSLDKGLGHKVSRYICDVCGKRELKVKKILNFEVKYIFSLTIKNSLRALIKYFK